MANNNNNIDETINKNEATHIPNKAEPQTQTSEKVLNIATAEEITQTQTQTQTFDKINNENEKEASKLLIQIQTENKIEEKLLNKNKNHINTSTIITTTTDTVNISPITINTSVNNEYQKQSKKQTEDKTKQIKDNEIPVKDELSMKIDIIKKLLKECDGILIGAGAGLSVAAGLDNKGLHFEENFKDFIDSYGITDLYSGGFYPYQTPEEKWGYFSRNCVTYIDSKPTKLYKDILKLVKNKNYFVLTTNVDDHFEKGGFDTDKIFATQGDFIHLQCSVPCHNKLYESIDLLKEMVARTKDRKIPTELIPICPKCGEPMTTHLRMDHSFVMDDYWYQQNERYINFINNNKDKKILVLEFGVGFNTPSIIRFPFERYTMNNENWYLIRFNKEYSGLIVRDYDDTTLNDWKILKSIKYKNDFQNRFIPISEDINEIIKRLLE